MFERNAFAGAFGNVTHGNETYSFSDPGSYQSAWWIAGIKRFGNVQFYQDTLKTKRAVALCAIVLLILLVTQLSLDSSHVNMVTVVPSKPVPITSCFVLALSPNTPIKPSLKCDSCGLVTSSGILLGSNAGAKIDSNDCVFRMDAAPTLNYEIHVGKKTTVRVISDKGLQYLSDVFTVLQKDNGLQYGIVYGEEFSLCSNCTSYCGYLKIVSHFKGTGTKFLKTSEAGYEQSMRRAKELGLIRANGVQSHFFPHFFTLQVMQELCQHTSVYGLETKHPCSRGKTFPSRYWEIDRTINCKMFSAALGANNERKSFQQFTEERNILVRWAQRLGIKFFMKLL